MLSVEVNGGVMVATLSRPPVNALNEALIDRLDAVLDQAVANESVCVLHIRSDQKPFFAELDDFTIVQRLVFRVSDLLNKSAEKNHCKERYR